MPQASWEIFMAETFLSSKRRTRNYILVWVLFWRNSSMQCCNGSLYSAEGAIQMWVHGCCGAGNTTGIFWLEQWWCRCRVAEISGVGRMDPALGSSKFREKHTFSKTHPRMNVYCTNVHTTRIRWPEGAQQTCERSAPLWLKVCNSDVQMLNIHPRCAAQ